MIEEEIGKRVVDFAHKERPVPDSRGEFSRLRQVGRNDLSPRRAAVGRPGQLAAPGLVNGDDIAVERGVRVGVQLQPADADAGQAERVRQRLGHGDADAEAGVHAGAGADEDGGQVALRGAGLREQPLD